MTDYVNLRDAYFADPADFAEFGTFDDAAKKIILSVLTGNVEASARLADHPDRERAGAFLMKLMDQRIEDEEEAEDETE